MKTIIFCGGQGIRLRGMSDFVPKAMLRIAGKPILWHVMKMFSKYGHKEFILALGNGGDMIREYFFNYNKNTNDVFLDFNNPDKSIKYLTSDQENEWKITLVDTGESAGTGARLFRCKQYLEDGDFFATYTDCLSNVVLGDLLKFHNEHNKIATITGVLPPFRYGEFILKDNTPISYSPSSKLNSVAGIVNGGFMVFRKGIFNYVDTFDECTIEGGGGTFEKLLADAQLQVFPHSGFWQCLDNDREYKMLNDLCEKNSAYWLV